jgi:hypothetical protein
MSTEFVKQSLRDNLTRTLIPHIADGLWSVYDSAKSACDRNGQPEKTLQTFQNLLTRIPQWNVETLDKEVDRITVASKCDYIEDLLLGVFVSYIRAFATLQHVETEHVEIPFESPTLAKFIHALYIACARKCWAQAFLFKTIGVSSEQQARNRRDIEATLEATLGEVIDSFIPWKQISRAYFHARETPARPSSPAEEPAPAPAPVTFGENEVREFEEDEEDDDDSESHDGDRPRVQLGEDIALEDDDVESDGGESTDTEAELEKKAGGEVALNL